MEMRHPKRIRRQILLRLYDLYMMDPLEMLSPEDFLDGSDMSREELVPNVHYLHDRGLAELMLGFNPPMFDAVRITANGVDLVENRHEFNLRFPPAPEELDEETASVAYLLERLVEEADCSALGGETRRYLLRDIDYLRDEVSRPVGRWRGEVIQSVLRWIDEHFDGKPDEQLPSLRGLKETLDRTMAF